MKKKHRRNQKKTQIVLDDFALTNWTPSERQFEHEIKRIEKQGQLMSATVDVIETIQNQKHLALVGVSDVREAFFIISGKFIDMVKVQDSLEKIVGEANNSIADFGDYLKEFNQNIVVLTRSLPVDLAAIDESYKVLRQRRRDKNRENRNSQQRQYWYHNRK